MQIKVCVPPKERSITKVSKKKNPAKALYRRAMAHGIQKDEEKQEADLIAANKLVPEDTLISGELARINQHKKEIREREKKAYKKLFS